MTDTQTFLKDVEIRPIGDRIVLEQIKGDRVTKGGILLPADNRDYPRIGRVLAAGEGRISAENVLLPMPVKKGDVVMYANHSGTEVRTGPKPSLIILELDDVLAVIDGWKEGA